MSKLFSLALIFSIASARAQDKKMLDSLDRVIIAHFIVPAEQKAGTQEPEWHALRDQIRSAYLDVHADRAIAKAKISYYYRHQAWSRFSTAIAYYTRTYVDKEDLKQIGKNVNYILEYSTDLEELKTALTWISHAMIREPTNPTYKATFEALSAKVNTQH
jgi:hypothetical protein